MTKDERSEVRDMITVTLSGWHETTVEREKLIYASLNNIDSHLDKLNGKVAAHEETILKNLPHGIQHCPQANAISEIHEKLIERDTTDRVNQINWGKVVTYGTFIIGMFMAWLGYKELLKETKDTNNRVQTTNDVIINSQSRGYYYDPFAKDTLKDTIK